MNGHLGSTTIKPDQMQVQIILYTLATLYTLHCTRYIVRSTLYTVHSTLYSLLSTLYTLHSTLFSVHFSTYCIMYILTWNKIIKHFRLSSCNGWGIINLLKEENSRFSLNTGSLLIYFSMCIVHCTAFMRKD